MCRSTAQCTTWGDGEGAHVPLHGLPIAVECIGPAEAVDVDLRVRAKMAGGGADGHASVGKTWPHLALELLAEIVEWGGTLTQLS